MSTHPNLSIPSVKGCTSDKDLQAHRVLMDLIPAFSMLDMLSDAPFSGWTDRERLALLERVVLSAKKSLSSAIISINGTTTSTTTMESK